MRLSATNLSAMRGGRRVFTGLSFAVGDGEMLAVIGPNGAGKSTLLRLIAGLLEPATGAIAAEPASEAGLGMSVHYLGHLDGLKPSLTVQENLVFWRRVWGGGDVAAALDQIGLGHVAHLPAAVLSAGQRRRAAIARLLLAPRPIWLLDEPTAALDAAAEAMLVQVIAKHRAAGGMVIAATHRDLPGLPDATLQLGRAA